MLDDNDNNPKYVTTEFCNERFGRIMDKLDIIDKKVEEIKQSKRDWKMFLLSIASGCAVAVVTWLLSHLGV